MKKCLLIICMLALFIPRAWPAAEVIDIPLNQEDLLAFNNTLGGRCYAMSATQKAIHFDLLSFHPDLPKMDWFDAFRTIDEALCNEVPGVITGFKSVEELSTEYDFYLRFLLSMHNTKLDKQFSKDLLSECDRIGIDEATKMDPKTELQAILSSLKKGDPVILPIDGTFEDKEDRRLNHAILVHGARILENDKIIFSIYDPNKPNDKKLIYKDNIFYFETYVSGSKVYKNVPTKVKTSKRDQNRFSRLKKYQSKKKKLQEELGHNNATAHGKLKSRGKKIGQKTSYELTFEDQPVMLIKSKSYNLDRHLGKNIVFGGNAVWKNKDEILIEEYKPVFHVSTLYERQVQKKLPKTTAEKQQYIVIGAIESRGRFMGQKGAYTVKVNGKTYILKNIPNDLRAFVDKNEAIGIKGKVVAHEGNIPVIDVSNYNDFNTETYEEIQPDWL